MELKDLQKPCFYIRHREKDYELNPFTLSSRVWCHKEFKTEDRDGLFVAAELLAKYDPETYLKFAYHLLKDKEAFPTFEKFVNSFKSNSEVLGTLYAPVANTLADSNPDVTEDEQDLKEVKKKATMKQIGFIFMTCSLLGMAILFLILWSSH